MTTIADWAPDPKLQHQISDQFDRAIESYKIHPDLVEEHANHEESIRTGGYAKRTLLELVQNAADALAGSPNDPEDNSGRVEIVLDTTESVLYCANAGRPFSESGIRAITMAYLSSKRGDEIGRFGLGFKSVLAISNKPQVYSRSISFEFNSEAARAALEKIAPRNKQYPILRTATVADPASEIKNDPILAEMSEWASTIIRLPEATHIQRLIEEIKDFSSEFLLFVRDVREVHLKIIGDDSFETSHTSLDLGAGAMRLGQPDGTGEEWYVKDAFHSPSTEARKEVGEAVSREKVKVTVALPAKKSAKSIGEFWAYFPLQDRTSASALFNAPWAVNDDRTTLLKNDYNREMLQSLAQMFVELLPNTATSDDPAAHLDYMPARGRKSEMLGFGDELLITHIQLASANKALIPNANGALSQATELRPLDFGISFDGSDHKAWAESPNTGTDVPNWRCYTNNARITRLRELCASALDSQIDPDARDMKHALTTMPQRGLLSWLREWAEGKHLKSAEDALRLVAKYRTVQGIERANVIPTTDGLRSPEDRYTVFLKQEEDLDFSNATFVDPEFLTRPGVEQLLRKFNFRDLDPLAILKARASSLDQDPDPDELTKLWDAVLNVQPAKSIEALLENVSRVRVPTMDGGWNQPRDVFDIDGGLGEKYTAITLDRSRCLPTVAHKIGVISAIRQDFSIQDEPAWTAYDKWIKATLNDKQGPGERPIENIDYTPGEGPGPFSILPMLAESDASATLRESWTTKLLEKPLTPWIVEDIDTHRTYSVMPPARWAAETYGILNSDRGHRKPRETVSPSLLEFQGLIPLYKGPRNVAIELELPAEIESVPTSILAEALESELFPPSIDNATLTRFIVKATSLAFADSQPARIPARVRRAIESCAPATVFLAISEEQREYLSERELPYLTTTDEQAEYLAEQVGCRNFEDSFAFSIFTEGLSDGEKILDLFPGLRGRYGAERVAQSTITRAEYIAKRVTTEEGTEDQALNWHLDGANLLIHSDTGKRPAIKYISDAFDLQYDNAEIDTIMEASLAVELEKMRQQANSAKGDAERLDVYFGAETLRETLPTGLWAALKAQQLVNDESSMSELFLTVFGSDSIRQLHESFRQLGFPDVPATWAGGSATISWLRKMGFSNDYAGKRAEGQPNEFVVPGAVKLNPLHNFQQDISSEVREVINTRDPRGRHSKAMVELPTGSGKTRVASETILRMFVEGELVGPVVWIAQSQELCEQAVQTWSLVWRGLGDERPLTIARLWDKNEVHEPDTEFSVIIATDAKLDSIVKRTGIEYDWLSEASLVIIDEGHRAGDSAMYTRILTWLGIAGHGWERPLIGLSATPFRGTSASGTKSLANRFGNHIIRSFDGNAHQELTRMNVLARVRHAVLPGIKVYLQPSEMDEAQEKRRINRTVLDRIGADQQRMLILVDHIMGQDKTWPILVFTPNVLSAQVLAASLRYRGVKAASVSGQTGRQERRDVIEKFHNGDIQVLANCDLLIQGFDAPGVRALYIARPTFSPNAYIQMAGRGLRGTENGGKDECLIVDMADDFGSMNHLLGYRDYEHLWDVDDK